MFKGVYPVILWLLALVSLLACSEPTATTTPEPISTVTLSPTYTPYPTYTPLPTYTPYPTYTPLPTSTSTPMPTATPTPEPTPEPVLGSRYNPIPLGQVVDTLRWQMPYWAIVVSATNPNANQEVLAAEGWKESPQPGNQFFMVELEATYLGPESTFFYRDFTLKTVGQSAVVYDYGLHCGLIPDLFPISTELFTGGVIRGRVCWEVPSADVDSLQLIVDQDFGHTRLWFNLR